MTRSSINRKSQFAQLGTLIVGGVLGISLTYGSLIVAQNNELWRQVGNEIQPATSGRTIDLGTGDVDMASTTATSLKVGQTGTRKTLAVSGTGNIHAYANTIAATSTAEVDLQAGTGTLTALDGLPAWSSGDRVAITAPTSTPQTFMGLQVLGASASSTAGYIHLVLLNATGDTFTWGETSSTSWSYFFER